MAALQGLTGLYGPPVPQPATGETGTPPSDWGVPVSRKHAVPGDAGAKDVKAATPGTVIDTGAPVNVPLAGLPGPGSDATPDVHSAPTATHGASTVDDPMVYARQRQALHGRDLGGTNALAGHVPYAETPSPGSDGTLVDSPNQNVLATGVPGQLRSGSVGKDQSQGFGAENSFGFQFGHAIRRWFSDRVPQVMPNADDRPFLGKHPVWQNRLDNDSQFGAAGNISTGMMLAKTPTTDPTPWEQPPNPTYRSTTDYPDESGYAGGWVLG